MLKIRLWVSCVLLCCFAPTPALTLDDHTWRVEAIEKARNKAGVKGAAVVLIEDHKIVWSEAFGSAHPDGTPVTLKTEFEAASNGKMLTALLVMQLIEEGRFTLDTPLEDPRLNIAEGCTAPTLRHALSHSAGLGNNLRADEFDPHCIPGETFAYAGQGYMIIQDMVDRLASGTIEDVMMKRIFVPLQMQSASFTPRATKDFATPHVDLVFGFLSGRAGPGPMKIVWASGLVFGLLFIGLTWVWFRRYRLLVAIPLSLITPPVLGVLFIFTLMGFTTPVSRHLGPANLASSLQLSAPDLAKFALELMDPMTISPAARDLMFEEVVEVREGVAWASGIGIDKSPGPTTYWHWGSNPGFQSLFVIEPEAGDGIVILTNTGGFSDFISRRKGGYNFAKSVARDLLEIDGAWDVRGKR